MNVKNNPTIFSDMLINNFGHIVSDLLTDGTAVKSDNYRTALEFSENHDQYQVQLSLPGVLKEHVKISQEDSVLKIEAERLAPTTDFKVLHTEFKYGKYAREVRLPKNANGEFVNAKLQDGILSISIAKREESKPKNIEVK